MRAVGIVCAVLAAASTAQAQIAYRGAAQASAAAGPPAPNFQAAGTAVSGTGAVTVPWPAHLANDVGLLVCESAGGEAVTLSTPSGFAPVAGSPQSVGAGTAGTRITVFWARATSAAMAGPVVADPGDHVYCQILTYRGVIAAGDPWDVTSGGFKQLRVSGVTTTVGNTRVVQIASRDNDSAAAAFSGQTNANLTGITERSDAGTNSGNGGGFAVWDGVMAGAGATGDTTVTLSAQPTDNAFMTIALRPPASTLTIPVPALTQPGDVMIASISYRPCSGSSGGACTTTITPPAGWTQVNTVTDQTTGAGTGGFGNRLFVYRRVATGSEPANYTWTFGGGPVHAGAVGGIVSFSGVDIASPIVAEAGQTTASATSHAAPSISTGAETNTMLVSSHSANSSAAWAPPGGMTERVDAASLGVPNNLGISIEVNHQLFSGSGATGTRTASWTAPPTADTGITHMLALRPGVNLDHYVISYPTGASAVTCDPHEVTITGHNPGHVATAPAAGTVLNLSTSSGTGVWTTLVAGSGTWTPSGLNNGLATYTWPGGETSFTVRLRHNTPATVGVNLLDSNAKTEGAGAEDPSLTFADAAFRVTDAAGTAVATFGTHIAGKDSDTGFGAQTRYLQAIRTDTATGSCVALIQSKTVTVEMAGARINPTGGASQVSIRNSASSMVPVATSAGAPPGSYTGVSLTFDAQSKAPLVFNYPDAGTIAIYARYQLPAPPAATYVSGSSNTFVVRPFGLRISGVTTSPSPSPGDAVFAVAGQDFDTTLTAVAWKPGDDADSDGVPDSDAQIAANAATPNFGQESVAATAALTHTLNAPAGGNAGTLGGSTTFSGFVAGTRTQAVSWSEVGFINLFASSSNYLGSGQNVTNSAAGLTGVGRFRPDHFFLSGGTLTNREASSCTPASAFSYMDEGFGLAFTLQARNSAGTVTQNYSSASGYAKLDPATIAHLGLGAVDGTTNLTSRLDLALGSSGTFTAGAASVTLTSAIKRATPDNPDGPYNTVKIGVAPQDSDTVQLQASALDLDVDNDATNDHRQVGGDTQIRFGRLRLFNALGSSDRLALPVPMRVEYWDGSAFTVNTLDSCTTLARTNFRMTNYEKNLDLCETGLNAASIAFSSGLATGTLSAPGAGNDGAVTLRANLTTASGGTNACAAGAAVLDTSANRPYLLGRWDGIDQGGDGRVYDDDPSARAAFGLYGSQPRNFIFFRENY